MVTSQATAPVEHLTWIEICARYPDTKFRRRGRRKLKV